MTFSIPGELMEALPKDSLSIDWSGGIHEALSSLQMAAGDFLESALRESFGSLAEILLILVLAGMAETVFSSAAEKNSFPFAEFTAAAAMILVSVGEMDQLMGLGEQTVVKLEQFSKVLLPAMAAATATMGYAGAAAVRQVSTVWVCDVLLTLLRGFVMPLIWLHLAAAAAGAMLSDKHLQQLGQWIKKGVLWLLGGLLTLFSVYLGIAGAVSGSVDAGALRTVKRAVAASVPLVGGLLSAAAETVMSGAGILKNTVGIFGVLAILAMTLWPFLRLGAQDLCFKLTAFLASALVSPSLSALVETLAGGFALVLAVAGSCAAVLMVSIISSLLMVTI